MELDRRSLLVGLGALAALPGGAASSAPEAPPSPSPAAGPPAPLRDSYDFVVAGAGCFGAWTAWHLRKAGKTVLLLDPYGPANARASSGGESRVIRMSYGPDEVYTRFSASSLEQWKGLFARIGKPELFQKTGVLWLALAGNESAEASLATLGRLGIPHERLSASDLERRYPQMRVEPGGWGILEPESGALLARRAVAAVVADAVASGVDFRLAGALPPEAPAGAVEPGKGAKLAEVRLTGGERVQAGGFVYACGPWLAKAVPAALEERIFPTRQEVFFFGPPPADARFEPPAFPTWIDFEQEWYGIPSLESRGFKIANDSHGRAVDPDTEERVVSAEGIEKARAFLARRYPALAKAPLVETRVCQYENSSNGDFVLDRHPGFANVWLAGGGSGHGFKHGPAVGGYFADLIATGKETDRRFSVATKEKIQHRTVL